MLTLLSPYLRLWHLEADGDPFETHSSLLLPVRRDGQRLMLKVPREAEERRGSKLMAWWDGDGAALVIAEQDGALLMERASGAGSLADMARRGKDDAASRIICEVAARLHAARERPRPDLVPLEQWFQPLAPMAAAHGGILAKADNAASELLASARDRAVLHGDIHHENILDFGERGWLAIDPKGLYGDRTFDFANILRDPDFETATAPGRLARQATVIAEAASIDRMRLLQWTLAFAGLSASWILADGEEPTLDLEIAQIAAAELGQS